MVSTSRELSSTYSQLVDSAHGALATIESTELASRLRKAVTLNKHYDCYSVIFKHNITVYTYICTFESLRV